MSTTPTDSIEGRLARAAELRLGAEKLMEALEEAAELLEPFGDDIVLFWTAAGMVGEGVGPLVTAPTPEARVTLDDGLAESLWTIAGLFDAMRARDRILTALGVKITD